MLSPLVAGTRGEVLLQHGDPTVFGGDAQVFVFVERVFLVLVIAGRVRRAAEGVQREVAVSRCLGNSVVCFSWPNRVSSSGAAPLLSML